MKKVIGVSFKQGGKMYHFAPGELTIQQGDFVMVKTARGIECGEVVQAPHDIPDSAVVKELKAVLRIADSADLRQMEKNRADAQRAFTQCEALIAQHKLDMKLVDVDMMPDHSKILFYFTSDNRVDFRDLVKDLAGTFHTRIELRQIGMRDETRMIGGLGVCGQPFCCSRFLKDFQPVSIKMAKEQGLVLNPQKYSGACSRLMCCLAYEQPAYEYLNRITPGVGSVVQTPDGTGTVVEANLVSGNLRVRLDGQIGLYRWHNKADCTYLRGGKRAPQAPDAEPASILDEEDAL